MYDLNNIRKDFPILSREVYGKPLVYLDNAATTQKPLCVLDAMRDEYLNVNANVHRGVHYLSQQATDLHEAARETVRRFINAGSTSEIVFTRGTTEGMKNRVSQLKKSQNKEGLAALWDYSNAIQDISFEDGNPLNRLLRTFDLFKNYYHISARLDYEKLYGSFPDNEKCTAFESGRIKGYMLNEIDYVPVNYAMFLEHRLRLYILQSCVEYLVMPQQQYKNEIEEFLRKISYYSLTGNITMGIEYLNQKCPNFRLYPRLWQLFTYMMGGFLLTDLMDKEIQLLSNLSGVPYGEVMHALNVYDILFPIKNNWIRPINNTHIQRLNMMPAPLMGIGANLRRIIYRDDDTEEGSSYDALQKKLSSDYTFNNLLKWNQAGFNLLKNSKDLIKN